MQNRENNTKSLVEAALITAIIVVMMLINAYVPVFGSVMSFILPIPITILYLRHGMKKSIISIVVSGILVGILYNPFSAIGAAILYGLPGVVMGYGIKEKKSFGKLILMLFGSFVIASTINSAILIYLVSGENIKLIVEQISQMFTKSVNMSKEINGQLGLSSTKQMEELYQLADMYTPEFLINMLPAVIIITAMILALINFKISKQILKRFKYEVVDGVPFSKVYIDNRIIAILIGIYCIGIILYSKNIRGGEMIVISTQLVGMYLFLVIGTSAVYYFLTNRTRLGKNLAILIIVMSIFMNFIPYYTIIGLVESLLDLRKLDKNRISFKR